MSMFTKYMIVSLTIIVLGFAVSTGAIYVSLNKTEELVNVYNYKESVQIRYNHLQAAERSQRGYLLTGNRAYLREFILYTDELSKYPEDSTISKKYKEMALTIALFDQGKQSEAVNLVQTNEGYKYMELIENEKINDLKELSQRQVDLVRASTKWHNIAMLISSVSTMLGLIILWRALYQMRYSA